MIIFCFSVYIHIVNSIAINNYLTPQEAKKRPQKRQMIIISFIRSSG